MVFNRSTVATSRPFAAASSSLSCRSRRALTISSVTFFATCTTAAPSRVSVIVNVVTLKIRPSAVDTSERLPCWLTARPTAHCGNRPPHSPTSSHVRPRMSVIGICNCAASAALPRKMRPCASNTAIGSLMASNVASHWTLPSLAYECSRAFCTADAI